MGKDLTKILSDEESQLLFKGHREKFEFLLKEIEKLKDPKNPEILTFAAFLIEIQEIEFHLMNLIIMVRSSMPRKPGVDVREDKDTYDMTLGQMKNELDKFEAPFLDNLKKSLSELNKLRRRYAHHLFSGLDSWDKVMDDARRGIKLNDQVLLDISLADKYISENTEIGKLFNKKIAEKP